MARARAQKWAVTALGALLGLGLAVAGATLLGGTARADGDATTETVPRVIAYVGTLNAGGAAYTGDAELRFTLRDGGGAVRWSEERSAATVGGVPVAGGRFAVELGAVSPIEAAIVAADALTLTIEARAPWSDDWVALSGEQALSPVPWALWTSSAADFDVAGVLNVEGTTVLSGGGFTVGGGNQLGSLGVGGDLRVGGAIVGSVDVVPNAAIAWFDATSCPVGWQPYGPARGRVIVGANIGGARDLSATVGAPLPSGDPGGHTHTAAWSGNTSEDGAHTHSYDPPPATSSTVTGDHGEALISQNDGAITSPHSHTVDVGSVTSGSAGGHAHTIVVPTTETANSTSVYPQLRLLVCERVW